jgi:hypothetical protein
VVVTMMFVAAGLGGADDLKKSLVAEVAFL